MGTLVPGPPRIPKSEDAKVPYIKWCRKMNTVGPSKKYCFDSKLVEFVDATPMDREGQPYPHSINWQTKRQNKSKIQFPNDVDVASLE